MILLGIFYQRVDVTTISLKIVDTTEVPVLVVLVLTLLRDPEYMPRWDMEYAENGAHWNLFDMQGKHNVWFVGGGCVCEGVNSVMGYNQLLLSKMQNLNNNC